MSFRGPRKGHSSSHRTIPMSSAYDPDNDHASRSTGTAADDASDQAQGTTPPTTPPNSVPGKSRQDLVDEQLRRDRDFLRSPGPNDIGHSFNLRYRGIQNFLNKLVEEERGCYSQDLFDDVQAWLSLRQHSADPAREFDFLDHKDSGTGQFDPHNLAVSENVIPRPFEHSGLEESEGFAAQGGRSHSKNIPTAIESRDRPRIEKRQPTISTSAQPGLNPSSKRKTYKSRFTPSKKQSKDQDVPHDRSQSEAQLQLEHQTRQEELRNVTKKQAHPLSSDTPKPPRTLPQLPEFLFGETSHLETMMHNLIEQDLAPSTFFRALFQTLSF